MNSGMRPDFYNKNLATLKKIFPEIFSQVVKCSIETIETPENVTVEDFDGFVDIVVTSSGGATKTIYGEVNPITEAKEIFREVNLSPCDTLFVMGLGLGYHALTAVEMFSEKPFLVIFEPSLYLFAQAVRYVDLIPLLTYPYLDFYVGPDIDVRRKVEKYASSLSFGAAQLLSCFPPSPFYNDSYKSGYPFLKEWLKSRQNHRVTLENSSRKIFQNALENLPSLFVGQPLGKLRDVLKGVPAFCVAAGPSLNSSLNELKKIGNQALIIAFDSAVQALVEAGIKPNVVVTADLKDLNFEKLRNVLGAVRESVLIFALGANARNVGAFLSRRRIGVSTETNFLQKWLCRYLKIDCQVPAMTSVGQTAIFTAEALGLDPIILVGMDLAFPEGLDHADNTVFRSFPHPDTVILTNGVGGIPVSSQEALIADKVQVEKIIAGMDSRVINTSLGGVLLAGTEVRSLKEVVECGLTYQVDVVEILDGVDWQAPIAVSDIIHVYQGMLYDLAGFSRDCESGRKMVARFLDAEGSESGSGDLSPATEINEFYEGLKERWPEIGNILSAARFKEFQDMKCRQIRFDKNRVAMAKHELSAEEAGIIGDDLASLLEAIDYFSGLLRKQLSYYQGLQSVLIADAVDQKDKRLLMSAEINLEGKQFWRAENDFRSIEADSEHYFAALCGLASGYCRLGLWHELQKHLKLMEGCRPGAEQTGFYQVKLKERILELSDEIKKLWQGGLKEKARRGIMEYLRLVPNDDEILAIRDKIIAHDEERAASVRNEYFAKKGKNLSEEQLLVKAQSYLQAGDAEPAIGILEGLARLNKEKSLYFREKIGDIRLLQKDLHSARWHYMKVYPEEMILPKMKEKVGSYVGTY